MPSKLSVYNGATLALAERKIAGLTETSVIRRRLDTAWDSGVVDVCLSRGFWKFAIRSMRMEYDPSYGSEWGYRLAYPKTDDWVKTVLVASDEYFRCPLTAYTDEARHLFADIEPIYVKIVSNDTQYGMDIANWPANFTEFVEHSLALKVIKANSGSRDDRDDMEGLVKRLLVRARSTDAMDAPVQRAQRGSWAQARTAGYSRER